uniref:CD74 molecule n=1 Tax=Junco hyemalis TaxID=40217 RepID=A0A8C5NIC1_JUNHY
MGEFAFVWLQAPGTGVSGAGRGGQQDVTCRCRWAAELPVRVPQGCAGAQSRLLHALHPGGAAHRRPGCHRLLRVPAERADQQADQDLPEPAAGGSAEEAAWQSVAPWAGRWRGRRDESLWDPPGPPSPVGSPHSSPSLADAMPVNKMKMAKANTPLVMNVLHPASFEDLSFKAPASNKTEDIVKHLLLQGDPSRKFPELKDNLMDNLKHLRSTMNHMDWKSFESWMHKWLLFLMANNPQAEDRKTIPAEKGTAAPSAAAGTPDPEEMIFSGVDMLKLTPSKEG